MKKSKSNLLLGLLGLSVIVGIFSGFIPTIFVYSLSLLFAYVSTRYGDVGYVLPGLAMMLLGGLFLYGPSISLVEIGLLMLYGVFMGMSFSKRLRPEMIYFPTLAILFAIMLLTFFLQKSLLGVDGLEAVIDTYMNQVQASVNDPQLLINLRATIKEFSLSIVFLVAVMLNLFLLWIFSKILDIRKLKNTGRFHFEFFRLRELKFLQIIQLIGLVILGSLLTGMPTQTALGNLVFILIAIFYLQGLSLSIFLLKSRKRGRILTALVVLLSLTVPFIQLFLLILGLIEQRKDFRKLEKVL